jgi:TetR/AcrR family fatty acid metabolism transcriptional regulator
LNKKYFKRKDKILISAIDILDKSGIQGLTTKEIASAEGISEPAIYRQYKGKKDIILAIIDKFSEFDEMIFNTVTEQGMIGKDGINFIIESSTGYYQNYPQITTVMFSYDLFAYDEETNEKMKNINFRRTEFMTKLVYDAWENGTVRTGIPAGEAADIILGLIWYTTMQWKINGAKDNLKSMVKSRLEWILL